METIDTSGLVTCECGSVFFEIKSCYTIDDKNFIIHTGSGMSKLTHADNTVQYAQCICCGKIHIPRTSFSGRNILDRVVQLHKLFIDTVAAKNTNHGVEGEDVNTEHNSLQHSQINVQRSSAGSRSRKNNKD